MRDFARARVLVAHRQLPFARVVDREVEARVAGERFDLHEPLAVALARDAGDVEAAVALEVRVAAHGEGERALRSRWRRRGARDGGALRGVGGGGHGGGVGGGAVGGADAGADGEGRAEGEEDHGARGHGAGASGGMFQSSTRSFVRSGIATWSRLVSTPTSAGESKPRTKS